MKIGVHENVCLPYQNMSLIKTHDIFFPLTFLPHILFSCQSFILLQENWSICFHRRHMRIIRPQGLCMCSVLWNNFLLEILCLLSRIILLGSTFYIIRCKTTLTSNSYLLLAFLISFLYRMHLPPVYHRVYIFMLFILYSH